MADEKTIVEVAEEINVKVDGLKSEIETSIDTKAEKEAVDTLTTEVEELKGLKAENETIQTEVTALKAEIAAVREKNTEVDLKKESQVLNFLTRKDREQNLGKQFKSKTQGYENMDLSLKVTTADIIPNVAGGFNQLFGNFIDNEIYEVPKRDDFILNLVSTTTQPGTENVWYVGRVNETGNAQFIGEGDEKPLINAQWQEYNTNMREVAEFWKFSERALNHTNRVFDNFRTHANDLIDLEIDNGVWQGDGLLDNLEGITVAASPFVVPPQLAGYYTDANIWDVIHAVAISIELSNFRGPMKVTLNTVWKAAMKGIKNVDGDYIVPPFTNTEGNEVSGMQIVFNNLVGDDEILVGILTNYKTVFSETVTFAEGFENDDFRRNLVSYRLAAWLATYIPPQLDGSIIFDNISTIITLIDAP